MELEYPTPAQGPRVLVSPSRMVVGRGAVEQVGDYTTLYGDTALVVATQEIYNIHGETVIAELEANGIKVVPFIDVRSDPTVANVEDAYSRWETEGCEVIVTLGGGSSIDVGKAVGVLAANEGSIRSFAVDEAGYGGVPNPTAPLIAVNTTAGTGSEATQTIVLTDTETTTKFIIVSEHVVPEVAIEDPVLTLSLPKSHTAFTGIDALTHAIEAFVSVKAYSVPDDYARAAIRRIARSFPTAWANGDDIDARTDMMIGQLQAGQAFTNASVALVHGMARPLGAQLHIPHGLANALLLPYVMKFSAIGAPEKYAEIARIFNVADEADSDRKAAMEAADAVRELCTDVGLATYLDDFGEVPGREEFLDVIPEMAQDAIDSGSPSNNPRKPTKSEIESLFVEVYDDALAPDSPRRC